jgi:hypothetical protein
MTAAATIIRTSRGRRGDTATPITTAASQSGPSAATPQRAYIDAFSAAVFHENKPRMLP